MTVLNTMLCFIFGGKCVSCGKKGEDMCRECLADLPFSPRSAADWIFPVFDYRHPSVRKIIRLIKYSGRKNLAKKMRRAMEERMLEELSDLATMEGFADPLIVPIPLSGKRMRERGYNQAALLVRYSAKGVLERKETEHQARMKDKQSRFENIRGAFRADGQAFGRNIALVDDVLTTGATLEEARRALMEAGAKRVIAFTLSH